MHRHTLIGERIVSGRALARAHRRARALPPRALRRRAATPTASQARRSRSARRIIAVCDAYDAMTKQRPYSGAITVAEALEELRRCSGTQFNPMAVDAFCELIRAPRAGIAVA